MAVFSACADKSEVPDEATPQHDYRSVEEETGDASAAPESAEKSSPEQSTEESADGEPSRSTRRELMYRARRYQKRLVEAIGEQWDPPDFDEQRLAKLASEAAVYVRVDEKGHITSYDFRSPSGSKAFDRTIERCLKLFTEEGGQRLPMPGDETLKKEIVRRGFFLRQWHYGNE